MLLVDRCKKALKSAIACICLPFLGAYAEETEIPTKPEMPTKLEIPAQTEITIESEEQKEEGPNKLLQFTGNNFTGEFEEWLDERVTLKNSRRGCPVLVSLEPEGDWKVRDFGTDFVKFSEANGKGAITYPIGLLCMWTENDE